MNTFLVLVGFAALTTSVFIAYDSGEEHGKISLPLALMALGLGCMLIAMCHPDDRAMNIADARHSAYVRLTSVDYDGNSYNIVKND